MDDVIYLLCWHFVSESMITSLLSAREEGSVPPWLPPAAYGSDRMARLEVSREKEMARAHSKAVTSLDMDESGR